MKNNNRVTFAELEIVLKHLGFEKKVVPDTGVAYKHLSSGVLIAVPIHKSNQVVRDYVLAATRLQLDQHGVIEAKDFDSLFQTPGA